VLEKFRSGVRTHSFADKLTAVTEDADIAVAAPAVEAGSNTAPAFGAGVQDVVVQSHARTASQLSLMGASKLVQRDTALANEVVMGGLEASVIESSAEQDSDDGDADQGDDNSENTVAPPSAVVAGKSTISSGAVTVSKAPATSTANSVAMTRLMRPIGGSKLPVARGAAVMAGGSGIPTGKAVAGAKSSGGIPRKRTGSDQSTASADSTGAGHSRSASKSSADDVLKVIN